MNEITTTTPSWSDFKSAALTAEEYRAKFSEKYPISTHLKEYKPETELLDEIREKVKKHGGKIKILAIGAQWCGDCSREVPRMVRISEELGDILELHILYGVKVNPYHKKHERIWSDRHSPPEAVDDRFDLRKIPTFYVFSADGKFIGKIIERPVKTGKLEGDLAKLL